MRREIGEAARQRVERRRRARRRKLVRHRGVALEHAVPSLDDSTVAGPRHERPTFPLVGECGTKTAS